MASKNVNISFYLTLFEKEISTVNPISEYYLKDFAEKEFKEELGRLGIAKSIDRCTTLNL